MNIRPFRRKDAEQVHRLLTDHGYALPVIEWNAVGGHWLVAEIGSKIVACVMFAPGRPFGYIDFLGFSKDLGHAARSRALKMIESEVCRILAEYGAQHVLVNVAFGMKTWSKVLKKRGFGLVGPSNIFYRKL